MKTIAADIDAYVECTPGNLRGLIEIAERIDNALRAAPPEGGYGLAEALSVILTEERRRTHTRRSPF